MMMKSMPTTEGQVWATGSHAWRGHVSLPQRWGLSGMMRMSRLTLASVVIVSGWSLASCGSSTAPPADTGQAPAASQGQKPASQPPLAQAGPAGGSARPFTIANIFPPGPGRDPVLNTCGSCHTVVCSARGQRTAERWDSIRKSHSDKLTSLSSADLDVLFSYLKEHFNDTRPEPQIPAEFLQEGCTPY